MDVNSVKKIGTGTDLISPERKVRSLNINTSILDENKRKRKKREDAIEKKHQADKKQQENNKKYVDNEAEQNKENVNKQEEYDEQYENYKTEDRSKQQDDRENIGNDENGKGGSDYQKDSNDANNNGWNPDANSSNEKVFDKYKNTDSFSAARVQRIVDEVARASNVEQIDVIKTSRSVMKVVNASGALVAVKRKTLQKSSEQIINGSTSEGQSISNVLLELNRDNKLDFGIDEVTSSVGKANELRRVLGNEVLKNSGYNVSKMSNKEIVKLLNSNGLDEKTTLHLQAYLAMGNHAKKLNNLNKAKGKQSSSIETLANRLIGDDIDFINGANYIRRTCRSIKHIVKTTKSIINMLQRPSVMSVFESTPAPVSSLNTASSTAKIAKPNLSDVTKSLRKTQKTAQKASKTVRSVINASKVGKVTATAGAAVGSAGTGTAVATSGATVAGGATAAGGGTAAAAGGAAAGGPVTLIVLAVLLIIIIFVLFSTLFTLATGAIQGFFSGNIDSNLDIEEGDAKLSDSMAYKCYMMTQSYDDLLCKITTSKTIDLNYSDSDKNILLVDLLTKANAGNKLKDMIKDMPQNPLDDKKNSIAIHQTDANDTLINYYYNGSGVSEGFLRSNAKDILCAAAVLVENDTDSAPKTYKRYAENLWHDTHDIEIDFVRDDAGNLQLTYCDDGCSDTYEYQTSRDHRMDGIHDYFINTKTGIMKNVEKSRMSRMKTMVFNFHSGDWKPRDYGSTGDLCRFCPGHPQYYIKVTTRHLHDESLFTADTFTNSPGNASFWNKREGGGFFGILDSDNDFTLLTADTKWTGEEFQTFEGSVTRKICNWFENLFTTDGEEVTSVEYIYWAGWDDSNKEWALSLYEDDWYELYGINFANTAGGMSGTPLDPSLLSELISDVESAVEGDISVSEYVPQVLKFALSLAGRVPYYWGGKMPLGEKYVDHDDTGVIDFINEFYPYLGTQSASLSTVIDGGIDSKTGKRIQHLVYDNWRVWNEGFDPSRDTIGLDCSGFVCFVYRNYGITLPDGTYKLSSIGSKVTNSSDLKPGDLLIDLGKPGHVVIFVKWDSDAKTSYTTVESSGLHGVVVKSGVTKEWQHKRRVK